MLPRLPPLLPRRLHLSLPQDFKGASTATLGRELRARWAALSFDEQREWEGTAAANKAAHTLAMEEFDRAMDVYNGKVWSLRLVCRPRAPNLPPSFRRCGRGLRREQGAGRCKVDELNVSCCELFVPTWDQATIVAAEAPPGGPNVDAAFLR